MLKIGIVMAYEFFETPKNVIPAIVVIVCLLVPCNYFAIIFGFGFKRIEMCPVLFDVNLLNNRFNLGIVFLAETAK